MGSYITGVFIALVTVLCLYVGLELAAGNSLFTQERLGTVTTEKLVETANDYKSPDQIDAIVQLGKRPMEIDTTIKTLATLCMSHEALIKTAAESALNEVGAPAAELIRPFFEEKTKDGYKIGCSAVRAIGPSCKMYLPEIKMLVGHEDLIYRRSGLYALQGFDEDAIEALDEVIKCLSDKDFNNQIMACRVLEKLGPKASKAEPELMTLLEEGVPSTRGWAAVCLAGIGETPTNGKVIELIAKKMQSDTVRPLNPVEHQRYIKALAMFGPKASEHLDKIREKLKHRDKFIQLHSAFAIYKITGKADESMDVFKSMIEQEVYASDALELVSQMGDKALPFVPSIMNCLDSPDAGNREMALSALANIGPKAIAAKGKVEELIEDEDALVRIAARATLEALEPADAKKK